MKGFQIIKFERDKLVFIPHLGWAFRCIDHQSDYITLMGLRHHPLSSKMGTVSLHRLILFEHLKRPHESECHWCGFNLPWKAYDDLEFRFGSLIVNVDHVDGDTQNNDASNLVPSCWWCNTGRGYAEFYPEAWEKYLAEFKDCHPKFRISVREILEEEGYENPYSDDGKFAPHA